MNNQHSAKPSNLLNSFITVNHSKVLYGIAALLMVYYHCLCVPERLNYDYIPVLFSFDFEARLAYVGKLCVAIYAFITGYALSRQSERYENGGLSGRLKSDIKISGKCAFKFYQKLWFVIICFVPIGILFFNQSSNPVDLLKCVFLGGGGYNGE